MAVNENLFPRMRRRLYLWRTALERAIVAEDTNSLDEQFEQLSTVMQILQLGRLVRSSLLFAIEKSTEKTVLYLINKGSSLGIEREAIFERDCLHRAVERSKRPVVNLLLSQGCPIDQKDESGRTALHVAVKIYGERYLSIGSDDPGMICHLLDSGADVNAWTISGNTPLLQAAKCGSKMLVQILLRYGANVRHRDADGYNALHRAVEQCHSHIVEILLDAGIHVNSFTRNGRTALHLAADSAFCEKTVDVLIKRGAYVNSLDNRGETPIFLAARIPVVVFMDFNINGRMENTMMTIYRRHLIIRSLLDAGAEINQPNNAGESAFHLALISTRTDSIIELFLERGGDVFSRNAEDQSVLHLAIESASKKIVKMILDRGVPIDDRTSNGATPLHIAVQFQKPKVINLFLGMGVNVNATDSYGCTPLHYAARLRYLSSDIINEIATMLLDKGADLFAKADNGESPFDYAVAKSNDSMVSYLLRHLASLAESRCSDGLRRNVMRLVGTISSDSRLLKLYQEYCQEIVIMKSEMIHKKVSYFEILTGRPKRIVSLVQNVELVDAFKKARVTKKFPLYGKVAKKRYKDAVKRLNLNREAVEYLAMLFTDLELPILEEVVKYFQLEDLKKFVNSCHSEMD